jgi:hypothetical protein
MSPLRVVEELVGWLHIVLEMTAIVVCLFHVRRSVWARVLTGGFLLQLAVSLFYRVASYMTSWIVTNASGVSVLYLLASTLGLLSTVVIVVGLAGLLAQLAGMSARLPGASAAPRPAVSAPASPVDPA